MNYEISATRMIDDSQRVDLYPLVTDILEKILACLAF